MSGANNEFARLSTLGTGITVTDPSNIIDAQDSNTIVTGDHRRRALTGVPAPATSVSSIQRVAPFYSPEGDILGYVPIYSSSAVEYEALIAGTPGLVSRWKLDETVGTTADDDIGGNDGTYNGGATLNQTALVSGSGKSVLFDGVNDNVQVPDAASLDITGDLSLEAWVKLTSKGASEHTIFLKNGSYYMRVIEGATTHYVQFLIWSGAVLKAVTADAGSFTLGTKHHLVGTYDGTNLRVYVDGVLVKTGAATGAIDSTASDLLLMSGVGWAKGNGDDFAVYNVTLPPQTISDHHEVGA